MTLARKSQRMFTRLRRLQRQRRPARDYDRLARREYQPLLDALESVRPAPLQPRRRALAFVAPQLLGARHAPTANALEYCRAAMLAGWEVLLVDAEGFPTAGSGDQWVANRERALDGATSYRYDGVSIPYWRPSPGPLTLAKARQTLRRVTEFRPTVVLSQQSFNLVGDVLAIRHPSLYVLTAHDYHASCAKGILLGPGDPRVPTMRPMQVYSQRGVARHVRPEGPPPVHPEGRAPFRWAVVGNRLGEDICEEFRDITRSLVEAGDDVVEFGATPSGTPHHRYGGNAPSLPIVYRDCHGYLNPLRNGGGNSAFEALRCGLPVVSLPGGDVATYLGSTAVDSLRHTAQRLSRSRPYYDAFRRAQSEQCRPELRDTWEDVERAIEGVIT